MQTATQVKSKAELIREHLPEIEEMHKKGDTLEKIRKHLESKLNMHLSIGSFYGILSKKKAEGSSKEPSGEEMRDIIHLAPEKVDMLKANGYIEVIHKGYRIRIESKKWCCKKLQRYARNRGKLVVKFKVCPFCSAKR